MRALFRLFLVVLIAGACTAASAQQTGRRVALVIGNSAYVSQGALSNPGPDSRLVADALRRVGFEAVAQTDLGKPAMERALRDFSRSADGAEVALIYYAGHGMEANDKNWLLPTDIELSDDRDLPSRAVRLDAMIDAVAPARGLRVVVLDACRNNPFARLMQRNDFEGATVTRGLADVEVSGTLVVFSARGGTLAQDGPAGGNSPFALAFARRAVNPDEDIRLLFPKVRDDVMSATNGAQEPFTYGSLTSQHLTLTPVSDSVTLDLRGLSGKWTMLTSIDSGHGTSIDARVFYLCAEYNTFYMSYDVNPEGRDTRGFSSIIRQRGEEIAFITSTDAVFGRFENAAFKGTTGGGDQVSMIRVDRDGSTACGRAYTPATHSPR